MKVGYLYYHKNWPDEINLCIEVDENSNTIYFKQLSGELDWDYYNKEESLWQEWLSSIKEYMIEIGPDCKAVRAIYL